MTEPQNTPAPPFKPTEITMGEIINGNTPPPADPPATPPVQQPSPQPQQTPQQPPQDPPVRTANPLDGLFGPVGEPDPNPQPDPPQDPPQDPPGGDTPAKLREALAAQKAEFQARFQAIDAEKAEAIRRAEELQAQIERFRQEQSLVDPTVAPEVVEVSTKLDGQIKAAARLLSPKSAREFLTSGKEVIEKYAGLGEVYDQGYDQRHAELRSELNRTYGADADEVFRALPSLAETVNELKSRVSKVANGSEDIIYRRMEEVHLDASRQLDETYSETLVFDEELSKAKPFAPQNIIAKLMEASPEFKEQSEAIKGFLRNSLIPPRPIGKAALAAMTPEQRQEAQRKHAQSYQEAYSRIHKTIPLALHTMAALPVMAEMIAAKNREIADLRGLLPPGESHVTPNHPNPALQNTPPPSGKVRPIELSEIHR